MISLIVTYVNNLFKAEHTAGVFSFIIVFLTGLRIMGIRMMTVEEFDDVEAAFVDIEVDVPGLEIRRAGLPDLCLRIEAFDFLPGSLPKPFAVRCRVDEQQVQVVVLRLLVDRQNKTSYDPAVLPDAVSDTIIRPFRH